MTVSAARDALVLVGLGCAVAGVWLVAGMGVALIALGVLLGAAGLTAELRDGDS